MDAFFHDLRHALRSLARQPGWAFAVGLTLALSIGATTAIFSLVDAVLLRPLGFPHPEQLVVLWESKIEDATRSRVAPATFLDWRQEGQSFAELAAVSETAYVIRDGGDARRIPAMQVTPGFFRVLGVAPGRGRAFSPDEAVPGQDRVTVVSHAFWQRRLGGRADAVGSRIELSDESYTVVGVLPPDFRVYQRADVFTPLGFSPDALTEGMRGARYLRALGRLRDGVTLDEAGAAMNALAGRLAREHPNLEGWRVALVPWRDQLVGSSRLALWMLLGAVVLVLVIASANVAHLLLARSATRRREMAIRGALGAGRGRLLAQLLTESLAVALLGGALGLLVAAWCVDSVGLVPWPIPRLDEVTVDARVIFFGVLLSLATGLATGLVPALAATRPRLAGALRPAGLSDDGGSRRLRGTLIVGETALALVLLVGAGLLVRSFALIRVVNPGFRAAGTIAMMFSPPASRYGDDARRRAFAGDLVAQLDAADEVSSTAAATNLPISGSNMTFGFTLPDRPRGGSDPERVAEYHAVTPAYFRTMGIPLVEGRAFDGRDRAGGPPVALVNQALAERFWPGEDPIGRRLATAYDSVEREIVGVVGSVRHFGLASEPQPEIYVPWEQNPWGFLFLVARSANGETEGLAAVLKTAVAAVDPQLPVDAIMNLEEQVSSTLAPLRFQTLLVSLFGLTALLLTMLGLYGVVAYSFARRTREVAVHMALGARRADVAWQFLRQGLGLTLAGIAIGTVAALLATRFLSGFLYGVGPRDPVTFAAVAALLGAVAFVACLRPALRAARLEPMTALRCE